MQDATMQQQRYRKPLSDAAREVRRQNAIRTNEIKRQKKMMVAEGNPPSIDDDDEASVEAQPPSQVETSPYQGEMSQEDQLYDVIRMIARAEVASAMQDAQMPQKQPPGLGKAIVASLALMGVQGISQSGLPAQVVTALARGCVDAVKKGSSSVQSFVDSQQGWSVAQLQQSFASSQNSQCDVKDDENVATDRRCTTDERTSDGRVEINPGGPVERDPPGSCSGSSESVVRPVGLAEGEIDYAPLTLVAS